MNNPLLFKPYNQIKFILVLLSLVLLPLLLSACSSIPNDPIVKNTQWPLLGGELVSGKGFQHQIQYRDKQKTTTFQAATWVNENDIRFIVFNNLGQKITEIHAQENQLNMTPSRHTMRDIPLLSVFAAVEFILLPAQKLQNDNFTIIENDRQRTIEAEDSTLATIQYSNDNNSTENVTYTHHLLQFDLEIQTSPL